MKNVSYASVCGSLMYPMVATWPDIAHAVKVVSRFMANLSRGHCEAIKSTLRYLNRTRGKCLRYGKGPLELNGFFDSDMQVIWIHTSPQLVMYTVLQLSYFMVLWVSKNSCYLVQRLNIFKLQRLPKKPFG